MKQEEALREIQGFAKANRVQFTKHARLRLSERVGNQAVAHALHALKHSFSCVANEERWRVCGPDLDGDELTLVVVLEDGVLVVTVF